MQWPTCKGPVCSLAAFPLRTQSVEPKPEMEPKPRFEKGPWTFRDSSWKAADTFVCSNSLTVSISQYMKSNNGPGTKRYDIYVDVKFASAIKSRHC